jgi:hypothetical protein
LNRNALPAECADCACGDEMPSPADAHDPAGQQLLNELLQRRLPVAWRLPRSGWNHQPDTHFGGFLGGSFNPLHSGHAGLRRAAERHLGIPIAFEMTIVNADKPALDIATVLHRGCQFNDAPLAVTTAATFAEKAVLFPGSVFVVGVDTAIRILDARFYRGAADVEGALSEMEALECRFLVAARRMAGRVLTLSDLSIQRSIRGLFEELPVCEFQSDVSSTRLRDSHRIG